MIRWSFQLLNGWVPVAPSPTPCRCVRRERASRSSASLVAASMNVAERGVRISISELISSPAIAAARSPSAASRSSSKRLMRWW